MQQTCVKNVLSKQFVRVRVRVRVQEERQRAEDEIRNKEEMLARERKERQRLAAQVSFSPFLCLSVCLSVSVCLCVNRSGTWEYSSTYSVVTVVLTSL